jgi:hypothetical protein
MSTDPSLPPVSGRGLPTFHLAAVTSLVGAATSPSLMKGKAPSGSHWRVSLDNPTGTSNIQSPTIVHFLEYASSASCHFKEIDLGEHIDMWQFCLIDYIPGKFPGFSTLSKFISNSWKHKENFTMHDSSWLIFAFSSKLEMLDILGGGPYFVFGRPLILKVMLEFFDFTTTNMMQMQMQMLIWVRLPNLPLKC